MVCTVERIITNEINVVDIIQCFISAATLWIAFKALSTWKKELIGKSKINLAMEIVEKVYSVEDLISSIRSPITTATEYDLIIKDIQKEYDRDKQPTIYRDKLYYLAPAYRIVKAWDKIQDFMSLKNKASLYWDRDIMLLFERILHLIGKVRIASKMLYNDTLKQDLIIELEGKIWENYTTDDEIKKEMRSIVEEFVINLEPIYAQQKIKWVKKKLK